jgi:hypothetical protein
MAWIDIPAGRWLVEIRPDQPGSGFCKIDEDERAHGGPGADLHIPGVHAWFDQMHQLAVDDLAEADEEQ